jgi:hypothetical protein
MGYIPVGGVERIITVKVSEFLQLGDLRFTGVCCEIYLHIYKVAA